MGRIEDRGLRRWLSLPRQEVLIGQPNFYRVGDPHMVRVVYGEDLVGDADYESASLLVAFHDRHQFSRFR
jgi:hypothetical protein